MANKVYNCKVCNKKLSKRGDICTNCFKEMDKYEKNNYENNEFLRNMTQETLDELSTKYEKFSVKKIGKNKKKAIVYERKYNYLKDNIMSKLEYTLLGLFIFLYTLFIVKPIIVPLIIILYAVFVYAKHIIAKQQTENIKLYLFNDKMVQKNNGLLKKVKEIPYVKIEDIREIAKFYSIKNEILVYKKSGAPVRKFEDVITIKTLKGEGEINLIHIILGITKFEAEEKEEGIIEYAKSSIERLKNQVENLNESKQAYEESKRRKGNIKPVRNQNKTMYKKEEK